MTKPLKDDPIRSRISDDTASTLFVNAGAGSGKTSVLVKRVVKLVLIDGLRLRHIAAVTFTEKAGAELRDRLRAEFEKARRLTAGDRRERASSALEDLDGAAIGTLHAFAQRLLMEHPIEAHLPPIIEVLDEVGSSVAFEERWSETQQLLLDDESIREPLLLGMALGVTLKHVRSLSLMLGRDWDLIQDRLELEKTQPPVSVPDVSELLDDAAELVRKKNHCSSSDDKLLPRLQELEEIAALLAGSDDIEGQLELISRMSAMKFTRGQAGNWSVPVADVRDEGKDLAARAGRIVGRVLDQCLRIITRWVAHRVLDSAESRRREGRLEFHDLLVLARDLLRHNEDARDALHHRYQRLLLDEFQDTDPIQIELATRIAGGASARQDRWQDIVVPDGRIFVVGDAKQSIYRFRRASIATYLEAQGHIGEALPLSTNFRSVETILDWVNAVFGNLIQPQQDAQPSFEPLDVFRTESGRGPAVTVLGATPHMDLPRKAAPVLRERESSDVAAIIGQAIDEGWQVYDIRDKAWRTARHEDIAVLVPARTSLPFLEDALELQGIPYRAEASSLVYQASEVRDLLACARAIADTSDELSLVTALRSPAFSCGDDDLWMWKQAGGRINVYSRLEDTDPMASGPVGQALDYLRQLSFDGRWLSPGEVLSKIIADRRMMESGAAAPRARDLWRRLRFVVDQARAWSEVSHGGLRAYLAWAAHQGQETSRVAESVLPEKDVNAVRVMTIHAAKGLEFPIVIVSGMTAQPRVQSGVRLLWPPEGGYEVKLASGVQTGDFEAAMPVDEQMDDMERLRLLYVATTRARDHLVVSLHRAYGSATNTAARLMAEANATSAANPLHFQAPQAPTVQPPVEQSPSPPPSYETWLKGIRTAQSASRRSSSVSASGLEGTEPEVALAEPDEVEPGKAKGARDLELPAWSKGRYGSEVGRAVHGVLQSINLSTGRDLDQAVAAQSVAEGVIGHEDVVRQLVQSALSSDLVKRAAEREHWRETYVGILQEDGTVLEGFVDLIYREDDGSLVIVDYKTDSIPAEAVTARTAYYKPQMDAYKRCLTSATSDDVAVSATLLFLHPSGAHASPV